MVNREKITNRWNPSTGRYENTVETYEDNPTPASAKKLNPITGSMETVV